MELQLGTLYTRREIHDIVGGGDLQSYLPHTEGRILCGCFDPELNRRAPYEVDVGNAPNVLRYAQLLAVEHGEIPVFLKRETNSWEYVGRFRATGYSDNPTDLAQDELRRQDAVAVIYLEVLLTPDQVARFLSQLVYEQDNREPPDNMRRGQFKTGWEDSTVRGETYAETTIQRLTWHNLGYRFGQRFGHRSHEEMLQVYDLLSELFMAAKGDRIVALPEEIVNEAPLVEGAVSRVSVNAYERNPEARRRCIAHYGPNCFICGFNFGKAYGLVGEGFIHVHHLRSLSEIGKEYSIDPIRDLRPVCPNCHAVLHRRMPAFSINEVKSFVRARRESPKPNDGPVYQESKTSLTRKENFRR